MGEVWDITPPGSLWERATLRLEGFVSSTLVMAGEAWALRSSGLPRLLLVVPGMKRQGNAACMITKCPCQEKSGSRLSRAQRLRRGVFWGILGWKLMGIFLLGSSQNAWREHSLLNLDAAGFHWVGCCPDVTSPLPTFLQSPLHLFTFFLFHKSFDVHKPSSRGC